MKDYRSYLRFPSVPAALTMLAGFGLAALLSDAAEARPIGGAEIFSPLGTWAVNQGTLDVIDGPDVHYCAIRNSYQNGLSLEFYGTDASLAAIKLDLPASSFEAGQGYRAELLVPPGFEISVAGAAANENTMFLNVRGKMDLAEAISNGSILYLAFENHGYAFSLSGLKNLQARFEGCATQAAPEPVLRTETVEKAPIAPPQTAAAAPVDLTAPQEPVIEADSLEIMVNDPPPESVQQVQTMPDEALLQAPATPQSAIRTKRHAQPDQSLQKSEAAVTRDAAPRDDRSFFERLFDINFTGGKTRAEGRNEQPRGVAQHTDRPQNLVPERADTSLEPAFQARKYKESPSFEIALPANERTAGRVPTSQPDFDALFKTQMLASPAARNAAQDNTQAQPQMTSEQRWRALKGSSMREVLVLWSLDANAELIWDSEFQFDVLRTVNVSGTYEEAVEQLLMQYETVSPGRRRPVGQLHVNPVSGEKTLLIRAERAF